MAHWELLGGEIGRVYTHTTPHTRCMLYIGFFTCDVEKREAAAGAQLDNLCLGKNVARHRYMSMIVLNLCAQCTYTHTCQDANYGDVNAPHEG